LKAQTFAHTKIEYLRILHYSENVIRKIPLRTRVIPERLRGVFTTRRYANTRLPYLT